MNKSANAIVSPEPPGTSAGNAVRRRVRGGDGGGASPENVTRPLILDGTIPLLILPALYLTLATFTMLQSNEIPGGSYFRIFGVNPLAAIVGMATEGAAFYAAVFGFGALWWYYIGFVGWKSFRGTLSRMSSGFGAFIAAATAIIGAGLTRETIAQDQARLTAGAIFQYAIIAVLFVGAIAAAVSGAIATFRRSRA
jgi:hypothetical protein